MKKWISLILAVCLLASMLALPAFAATKEEQNAADALNHLGLFLGTTKGYELDASLTRAQSAMLLVRMLGALKQAETGDYSHPFDDVAPWASRVVAYAYTNNLVKGYNGNLTAQQNGHIGGRMVQKMIEDYQRQHANQ